MRAVKLTDKNTNKQSIEELWVSIAKLSAHVVEDNELCKHRKNVEYPISVREHQLDSLQALLNEVKLISK